MAKEKSLGKQIAGAFINPFTVILMILAAVSIIMDIIVPITQNEECDPLTVSIILMVVLISGFIRFPLDLFYNP